MLQPKKILRWVPNNHDGTYDKMPGDFFYFPDKEWWKESQEIVQDMLDVLCKLGFIRGTCNIAEQGLYIDYRLPPSTHKF